MVNFQNFPNLANFEKKMGNLPQIRPNDIATLHVYTNCVHDHCIKLNTAVTDFLTARLG